MATATANPVIGVVLAGGRSRRMGQDKALLPWQGQSLLEHMMALLLASGAEQVIVSGDRPEQGGIVDGEPDAGPVMGLCSVLDTLPDGVSLLTVPVDMPLLTPALLSRLLTAAPATLAVFAEFMLPLRLVVTEQSRQVLREVAQKRGRERSLHAMQARLPTQHLPLTASEATQLVNLNTPEQWREALGA